MAGLDCRDATLDLDGPGRRCVDVGPGIEARDQALGQARAIVDVGYPRDPAQVAPLPGAIDALRVLQQRFALVIISNQSGIARGRISAAEAAAVHARVVERFGQAGVTLAGAYYCPHAPDAGCRCRKPAPGLLLDAAHDLGLDLAASTMLGDKPSDLAAGRAAGCHTLAFGPATGAAVHCLDWPAVAAALGSGIER